MQYPRLVESKTAANQVLTIEWNPRMDLLATVFSNGVLICSRLLSLQEVWHKQFTHVSSISWRPDGRVLAVAADDKSCTLHDVEDGKIIHTLTYKNKIASVSWFQLEQDNVQKALLPDCFEDKSFSHQLAHEQTKLNILMISTTKGVTKFYALGLFYLGSAYLNGDTRGYSSHVSKTHFSGCMRYLTTVSCYDTRSESASALRIVELDIFNKRGNDILLVAKLYAKITDELEYLEDTLSAITTSWTDVLAGLDSKLSSYCSRKAQRPDESGSGYTFLSADELLQLLVLGFPSDNLEKFLTDMSEKGLKKLNNAIEQTCLRVQNLIVKNAQKCCYHLHGDLNMLRGMSQAKERFQLIGLQPRPVIIAMYAVGSLVLKLTELQQVIDHSLKSTKSFFRWLISIACRMTNEQTNTAVPSDSNKMTQQDIQLITDFILENFDYNSSVDESAMFLGLNSGDSSLGIVDRPTCSNFTLEQVGQYFKNEPLSRHKYSFTKPETNFWIEFLKQRPELTEFIAPDHEECLLFYKHDPDRSLIQEHKRACERIGEAFKSVSSNIKETLKQTTTVTSLKQLISMTQLNRIHIETDIKNLRHYTLTRGASEETKRVFVISQSLSDKQYKLASVEFEPPLEIADYGFFEDKESKTLLVSFLLVDHNERSTIIVQIELNKIVENLKDIHKNYAKKETKVILKLDLLTEPAYKRVHKPEMMVKKIKDTIGTNMFSSSGRGVIAFTSCDNKRIHLYELESSAAGLEIMDDEMGGDEKIDESLIDTDLLG